MAHFHNVLQRVATQAVTMASLAHNHSLQELRRQLQPALTMAQERAETAVRQEFIEKHQDLKSYEPLLLAIADQLKGEPGFRTMTKEQAFKTVSERARAIIAKMPGAQQQQGGGTQGQGGQTQAQQGAQQNSKMNPLSGGGQAGAGGGGGGQQAAPGRKESTSARSVFG